MLHNSFCQVLLAEMEQHGRFHDASVGRHDDKLLNLDWKTAELVSLLIALRAPRRVLEIGTSNGFSAIWIALALQRSSMNFQFITVERLPARAQAAIENFKRAGIQDVVRCLVGEAVDVIGQMDGAIDCVFFDGDRKTTDAQFESLLPKLARSCILMTDNAVSHASELATYVDRIEKEPGFQVVTIPVGKGLHVAVRT